MGGPGIFSKSSPPGFCGMYVCMYMHVFVAWTLDDTAEMLTMYTHIVINNTQQAAIASLPSAMHPQLWAELYIHAHVTKHKCTLSGIGIDASAFRTSQLALILPSNDSVQDEMRVERMLSLLRLRYSFLSTTCAHWMHG